MSACVKRNSRDDITPQLSCQRRVSPRYGATGVFLWLVDRGLGRVDAGLFEVVVLAPPQVEEAEPGKVPSHTEADADPSCRFRAEP